MAETLLMVSKIFFGVAGICLVVTIIFFIRFKIPDVIGDLSGRNARKSIEQMREFNEKNGGKAYQSGKMSAERGTSMKAIHRRESKEDRQHLQGDRHPETGLLSENEIKFSAHAETEVLDDNEVTRLLQTENETVKLNDNTVETDRGIAINILDEVMIIHTDEVIQ